MPILFATAVLRNTAGSIRNGVSVLLCQSFRAETVIISILRPAGANILPAVKNGGILPMKKIRIWFEQVGVSDRIDVIIRASERDEQVTEMLESFSGRRNESFTVLDGNKCPCVIDESEILFISSEGRQMRIVAMSGIYTAKQTLQVIEKLLGRSFLRISRFEIINLKKVRKYDFTIIGTLRIEFENGMETWASRRYIPLIRERLSQEEEYLC